MIRYALVCEHEHPFEGWFGSSSDYDDQHGRGLVACPVCGSKAVRKQIMAPAVAGTKAQASSQERQRIHEMMLQAARQVREHVEQTFDNVGDSFADEARAIHEGRSEERGIYGQASPDEVRDLLEDGVPIAPMPPKLPRKDELN